MAPEKRFDDADEFADEENEVLAQRRFEKRELVAKVAGGLAGRLEEDEEVNGNEGDVGGNSADAEQATASGFERRERVGEQATSFDQGGVGELADGGVGELALGQRDPVRVVAFDVVSRVGPERRDVSDKGEQLVDEGREEQKKKNRENEGGQAVEQGNRSGPAKFEPTDKQIDDRTENEGEDAGNGERPEDAGEVADHAAEDDDPADDQGDGTEDGGEGEGEADGSALARGEKSGVGRGRRGLVGHGNDDEIMPRELTRLERTRA